MVKIRAEINKIENGKTIGKTNETKNCFFGIFFFLDQQTSRKTDQKRDREDINFQS